MTSPGDEATGFGNDAAAPVLRIVRGTPADEELAALIAVLRGRRHGHPVPAVRARWADPSAQVRAPLRPGSGAWQAALGLHRSSP